MTQLRRVDVAKEVYDPETNSYKPVSDGQAWFHSWSLSAEPAADVGFYSWPMAIIERDDGRVEAVEARHVKFIVPYTEEPNP